MSADFAPIETSRRIKDEDGNVIHQPEAPKEDVSAPSAVVIHETLQVKNWKPTPLPDLNWVDQQLLVQDIKASSHWIQQAQKVADSFEPTWSKLKLCAACALNQVPQQYDVCTSCENAKFPPGTPFWADELGRRHAL